MAQNTIWHILNPQNETLVSQVNRSSFPLPLEYLIFGIVLVVLFVQCLIWLIKCLLFWNWERKFQSRVQNAEIFTISVRNDSPPAYEAPPPYNSLKFEK